MPQIDFIGSSYKLRSDNVDSQKTINLYPVINEFKIGKEINPDTCGNPKHNETWIIKTNEEVEMMAKLFASDVS